MTKPVTRKMAVDCLLNLVSAGLCDVILWH